VLSGSVVTTPSSNLGQISIKGEEIFDTRHFMKLDNKFEFTKK
jgi:hypothetical protein